MMQSFLIRGFFKNHFYQHNWFSVQERFKTVPGKKKWFLWQESLGKQFLTLERVFLYPSPVSHVDGIAVQFPRRLPLVAKLVSGGLQEVVYKCQYYTVIFHCGEQSIIGLKKKNNNGLYTHHSIMINGFFEPANMGT